jgi:hypothetical protein
MLSHHHESQGIVTDSEPSARLLIPTPFDVNASDLAVPPNPAFAGRKGSAVLPTSDSGSSQIIPPRPSPHSTPVDELTEEQAQFVRELRSRNVPVAEIASLMETMRREREGLASTGIRAPQATAGTEVPPSYDQV